MSNPANGAAVPLVRLSLKDLRGYLKDRAAGLAAALAQKDKITKEKAREKIDGFRAGPGTMMIHLALSGLPDWTAGPDLKNFAYVHIAPDLEMMSRVYAEALGGLLPVEPALVVGQPVNSRLQHTTCDLNWRVTGEAGSQIRGTENGCSRSV